MTIISEIPNVEFDIRTLNTKIVFASENIDYKAIFSKCLGNYILFVNNKTSEIIFDEDFCANLENDKNVIGNSDIIVLENHPELYVIKKDFAIDNCSLVVEKIR